MHDAAFRALEMDWSYDLLDVPPEGLKAAVAALRAPDVAGANVTIPYKQAVMEHLDAIAPDAMRARAVNTIVNDGGRLGGFNTDIPAIRGAVEQVGVEPRSANAVILGGGGAARATAAALEGSHLTFVVRHLRGADVPGKVIGWSDPSVPTLTRAADLLFNATPLGRNEEMPLRPAALPRSGAVIDLVYVTGGTPLVRKARSLGLPTVDGWQILLAQGAESFLLWTGRAAPVDVMRDTLQP
ncbi:MAG: shikimate dehydrogenase [Chloroflexi bacterium]|nr:MAG: shikimate dehydrogenase [Chloroflexota bacterium]TME40519.1 MAG: shikimate dehydrogenase [Chloroflexota bacterium]